MGRCWPTRPGWTGGWRLGEGRQVLYVEWRAMQRRRSRVIVVRFLVILFSSHRVQTRSSSRRQLTFPAVPVSLPAQFTNLTQLESIEVVGDGNTPGMTLNELLPSNVCTLVHIVAGPFPMDFGALTKLTTLHLENTALGALPDTLQHLASLTLVRNAQVGSSFPPSVGGSALQSL